MTTGRLRRRRFLRVAAGAGWAMAIGLLGCGDDSEDVGNAGDPAVLVGTFQLQLIAPTDDAAGYTSVFGQVFDGPTPAQIIWEKVAEEGDCQLLAPRVPFCEEPCTGSAVCVEDGRCQDYPIAQSVGTVHVSGLNATPEETDLSMEPMAENYQWVGDPLPFGACVEGEAVRLDAEGSSFTSAFAIETPGIAPLELLNDSIGLVENQPVTLFWPAGQSGISRIHVKLDISHHGGTKGMIDCNAEDNGTLDISAALITGLLDRGVAGFPTVIVTRSSAGSATISAGRVDLLVFSAVEKEVDIPGIVSCSSTNECLDGQTCQPDLTCS